MSTPDRAEQARNAARARWDPRRRAERERLARLPVTAKARDAWQRHVTAPGGLLLGNGGETSNCD